MSAESKLKIAYAEPTEVIRFGLINTLLEFDFIIEASNGAELIKKLSPTSTLPDLCIVALNMSVMGGYATMQEIRKRFEDMPIMVFTSLDTPFNIIYAIQKGANGYLLKTSPISEIRNAINSIYKDGFYYTELANKQLFRGVNNGSIKPIEFSEKELLFISYANSKLSMSNIAEKMEIGQRALDGIRDRLFAKLKINNREALTALAILPESYTDFKGNKNV